ncbi:MAG: helix-turn-helix domain-containing protein [Clostridia bacterium]|nr:helix-turn-helix domain-containing protein [Clostridia bacterium]MDE7265658.1 helix-turn-helix domain-containing protein [Clostridia bacterium]
MLRIKQLRNEANLSQRALAAKINCSQKSVDLWEKGITEPKADIIVALANVFECTCDYLLEREDDLGSVNVMRELSESEKEILGIFDKLDKKGQAELANYGRYLATK